MNEAGGLRDVADGLGLLLSTQSFAARALIGSLVAAGIAFLVVRLGVVRTPRIRRALVAAPIGTAIAAALASAGDAFLPPLVVASQGAGEPINLFGEEVNTLSLQWLVIAWTAIASFLVLRRVMSIVATGGYVRHAVVCDDRELLRTVRRLSAAMEIEAPQLLIVDRCPGGAFTTGWRNPIVCVDASLVDELDEAELQGLLAHELAHIARRDVPLNVVLGFLRDLTFFVPPLHTAARWMRREQEHAADDMATAATGRPAALASSILKVWEGRAGRGPAVAASMACATMVPGLAGAGSGPVVRLSQQLGLQQLSGGARLIAARVVRLIDGETEPSIARQRVEMGVLGVVLVGLTAVTVALPAQFADQQLMLGGWSRPAPTATESPAMATFRSATAPAAPATPDAGRAVTPQASTTCDCLVPQTAGDWRTGAQPVGPARASGWTGTADYPWEDAGPQTPDARRARSLWGVDTGSGLWGVFIVR